MLNIGTGWILGLILCLIFIIWGNGLHTPIGAWFCTGWIFWLLLYLIFIIWRNGLHASIAAPAWMTNGHNIGIGAHRSFRQAPQFWTGQILWLLLYLIFIIWRNGLHVQIVAPAWTTNGCNNGIGTHQSFRQVPQFWTGWIFWLILYLIFIIWRNGLHVPIAVQFWTGLILWLLLYLIFTIWRNGLHVLINFHDWRNGLHVLQFWTGQILWLLLYLIFIIWRNGLHAPIAVPAWKDDCSACLKGWWVQQRDWRSSIFHAGATILNMSHFMVTTVSNFHNFYPQECPLLASTPIIGRCTNYWQVCTCSA